MTDQPTPKTSEADVAMQTRCPHCLSEAYALNVKAFSYGESGCHMCGKLSTPMTVDEWRAALDKRRRELHRE